MKLSNKNLLWIFPVSAAICGIVAITMLRHGNSLVPDVNNLYQLNPEQQANYDSAIHFQKMATFFGVCTVLILGIWFLVAQFIKPPPPILPRTRLSAVVRAKKSRKYNVESFLQVQGRRDFDVRVRVNGNQERLISFTANGTSDMELRSGDQVTFTYEGGRVIRVENHTIGLFYDVSR
jgi:hypothetical protein